MPDSGGVRKRSTNDRFPGIEVARTGTTAGNPRVNRARQVPTGPTYTVGQRSGRTRKLGIELGVRTAPLPRDTWTYPHGVLRFAAAAPPRLTIWHISRNRLPFAAELGWLTILP